MGARRIGLRGGSVFAGLVLLVGCNAIFGIEEGQPEPAEAEGGATSSGGASGTAQGGETSTGGSSGGNAGSGNSSSGGKGGGSTGGTDTGGANTGGKGGTDTGGAGGLAGSGAGAGGAGPGGAGGSGGAGPGGAGGLLRYDFEGAGDVNGFEENFDCSTLTVTQSTEQHFGTTGNGSLKITLTGPATDCDNLYVRRADPGVMPGDTVTFSIYFPPSSAGTLLWLDLIVEDTDYMWTIRSVTMPATRPGWATTTYTIPSSIVGPIRGIGFEIGVATGFNGSVYVDKFSW